MIMIKQSELTVTIHIMDFNGSPHIQATVDVLDTGKTLYQTSWRLITNYRHDEKWVFDEGVAWIDENIKQR